MRGLQETEKLVKDLMGIIIKMRCECEIINIEADMSGKILQFSAYHCPRCDALNNLGSLAQKHTCDIPGEEIEARYYEHIQRPKQVIKGKVRLRKKKITADQI